MKNSIEVAGCHLPPILVGRGGEKEGKEGRKKRKREEKGKGKKKLRSSCLRVKR